MSDAYIIELQGNAVGILVRRDRKEPAYKFLSTHISFNSLEGLEFPGPLEAERAARKLWHEMPRLFPAKPGESLQT